MSVTGTLYVRGIAKRGKWLRVLLQGSATGDGTGGTILIPLLGNTMPLDLVDRYLFWHVLHILSSTNAATDISSFLIKANSWDAGTSTIAGTENQIIYTGLLSGTGLSRDAATTTYVSNWHRYDGKFYLGKPLIRDTGTLLYFYISPNTNTKVYGLDLILEGQLIQT